MIKIRTTERRHYSTDLPQGGLEIPCLITFEGAGKDIWKVMKLISAALTPSTSKSSTGNLSPENESTKVHNARLFGTPHVSSSYI